MHKLDEIAEKVKTCKNCELCETRTKAVPGKGRFDADVIFVGEAPGRNEDIHGEPFVGAAGKRLDMILEDTGINREDVYITNIVKCRPPNNRKPEPAEITRYSEYLRKHISIINPKILVLLGSTAMNALIGNEVVISKARGKWIQKKIGLFISVIQFVIIDCS